MRVWFINTLLFTVSIPLLASQTTQLSIEDLYFENEILNDELLEREEAFAGLIDGNFPNQVIEGNFPNQIIDGNFPNQVMEGNFPDGWNLEESELSQVTQGNYPNQVTEGNYPNQVTQGNYPNQVTQGNYPDGSLAERLQAIESNDRYFPLPQEIQ